MEIARIEETAKEIALIADDGVIAKVCLDSVSLRAWAEAVAVLLWTICSLYTAKKRIGVLVVPADLGWFCKK